MPKEKVNLTNYMNSSKTKIRSTLQESDKNILRIRSPLKNKLNNLNSSVSSISKTKYTSPIIRRYFPASNTNSQYTNSYICTKQNSPLKDSKKYISTLNHSNNQNEISKIFKLKSLIEKPQIINSNNKHNQYEIPHSPHPKQLTHVVVARNKSTSTIKSHYSSNQVFTKDPSVKSNYRKYYSQSKTIDLKPKDSNPLYLNNNSNNNNNTYIRQKTAEETSYISTRAIKIIKSSENFEPNFYSSIKNPKPQYETNIELTPMKFELQKKTDRSIFGDNVSVVSQTFSTNQNMNESIYENKKGLKRAKTFDKNKNKSHFNNNQVQNINKFADHFSNIASNYFLQSQNHDFPYKNESIQKETNYFFDDSNLLKTERVENKYSSCMNNNIQMYKTTHQEKIPKNPLKKGLTSPLDIFKNSNTNYNSNLFKIPLNDVYIQNDKFLDHQNYSDAQKSTLLSSKNANSSLVTNFNQSNFNNYIKHNPLESMPDSKQSKGFVRETGAKHINNSSTSFCSYNNWPGCSYQQIENKFNKDEYSKNYNLNLDNNEIKYSKFQKSETLEQILSKRNMNNQEINISKKHSENELNQLNSSKNNFIIEKNSFHFTNKFNNPLKTIIKLNKTTKLDSKNEMMINNYFGNKNKERNFFKSKINNQNKIINKENNKIIRPSIDKSEPVSKSKLFKKIK